VSDRALHEALASSQRHGMLGDRSIDEVVEHAGAFVAALADISGLVVDLGSGGGVPGLVIAVARPDLRLLLIDRRAARTDHLERLVRRMELGGRVAVRCADAGDLALDPAPAAVVARGFGAPEVTASAAARLLRREGILVVSEPPDAGDRWRGISGFERAVSPDPRVAVLHRVPRGT